MGVAGGAPAVAAASAMLGASIAERLASLVVLALALVALGLVGLRGSLARSFVAAEHAPASAALVGLGIGLGVGGAALAMALSIAWAWTHRGALTEPGRGLEAKSARRAWWALIGAAALGGTPAALWIAPIALDAPGIEEELSWAGCSRFQRILVTRARGAFRLWLDGELQVESEDERAYHESLVHPALAVARAQSRALVLGGGDGLVAREILRDAAIDEVLVVDIDRAVTSLARTFAPLRALSERALEDPRVRLVHEDALRWLPRARAEGLRFDVVIADLPDPTSPVLAPLFARETFEQVTALLAPGGVVSIQAGAPRLAPRAFASLARTLEAAGLHALGLALDEPAAFGGTAVLLAARDPIAPPRTLRVAPRWLTPERLAAGLASRDASPGEARPTTLADPAVLGYLRAAMRRRRLGGPR